MSEPSTNGSNNGRGKNGKFLPGNKLGHGDPNADVRAKLRDEIVNVGVKRLPGVVNKLYDLAESGEQWAIQEILNRVAGRADAPVPAVAVQFNQSTTFATLTPEQQARMDELVKVGLATLGAEAEDEDGENR